MVFKRYYVSVVINYADISIQGRKEVAMEESLPHTHKEKPVTLGSTLQCQ